MGQEDGLIRYNILLAIGLAVVFSPAPHPILARTALGPNIRSSLSAANEPAYCIAEHNIGRMALSVANNGTFGAAYVYGLEHDCFTGRFVRSCSYPKGADNTYLYGGALWVGAVVGRDTLVSIACDGWMEGSAEFHPAEAPFGRMDYRSNIDPARPEYEGAVSEQDYIAVYYDTCRECFPIDDFVPVERHRPLQIEVTQRSYAWSYSYAQDFVLLDYAIKNIGDKRLSRVYLGIYVDADIHAGTDAGIGGYDDDLCGFREKQPALYLRPPCPQDSDIVNIAWTADNDGDFGSTASPHLTSVTATRIVRTPSDSLEVSFNWWIGNRDPALDFGPQRKDRYRDFGTGGLGTPWGDPNKYFVLSNREFDYDQPRVATISSVDSPWLPPAREYADLWATGLDPRYLLSFGPFGIDPGQSLPITLAYVAGTDFHHDSLNFLNLPYNPDGWYQGVNFDSLGKNATWADWVYDNPGVDTDGDGYSGIYTLCNLGNDSSWVCDTSFDTTAEPDTLAIECRWEYSAVDTVWRQGDGVPDFRGATPPPAPSTYSMQSSITGELISGLRVESDMSRVRVIWNGVLSENTPDIFTREYDFEGYRVWIGRDNRRTSYSVAASYDREDYNRFEWVPEARDFRVFEAPFTLTALRCLYADSCHDTTWHPLSYPRDNPLILPDGPDERPRAYYFTPQGFNRSILADGSVQANTPIRKVYPEAPKPPSLDIDSIRHYYPDRHDLFLTEEGFIKYYEYEFVFEGLLPTVPYWFNVTTFDCGSPESGLGALETNPTLRPVSTFAFPVTDTEAGDEMQVFVYPNPYRADGNYRERGMEGRGWHSKPDDRVRAIHFARLPSECTIRIHTLDGDLVREINHDCDPQDSQAQHDYWDLITRNSQQPVSGLYYWTVEDTAGRVQIGKLVIIM